MSTEEILSGYIHLFLSYPHKIKNHLLTSNCQSKMILLNNNHYQAAVYFLFPKIDFTSQQIKSFKKSRVMVGKLTSAGIKLGLLKFRE